jgi:hypothetical protein
MVMAVKGGPKGGKGTPKKGAARGTKLSDETVAELAQEMGIPEGLFQAVIERYPELNRVLARRYRASTCTA